MIKPKLIFMGLSRSGKSSIQKVVFHKMSPNETLFLESTATLTRSIQQASPVHLDIQNFGGISGGAVDSIMSWSCFKDFELWDFPASIEAFESVLEDRSLQIFHGPFISLVFVIDAQDDYLEALARLFMIITSVNQLNSRVSFEIFIHKVDALSEDHKLETQRDIQQRLVDELTDTGLDQFIQLNFYLTSIYDHSVYEAMSKVAQKLLPEFPALENLLNVLCANSGIEKAFVFDIVSKLYIATDSSPVDMQTFEICSDMIDVVFDVSFIYGSKQQSLPALQQSIQGTNNSVLDPVGSKASSEIKQDFAGNTENQQQSKSRDGSISDQNNKDLLIHNTLQSGQSATSQQLDKSFDNTEQVSSLHVHGNGADIPFPRDASCQATMQLAGMTLHLRQLTQSLVLVALIKHNMLGSSASASAAVGHTMMSPPSAFPQRNSGTFTKQQLQLQQQQQQLQSSNPLAKQTRLLQNGVKRGMTEVNFLRFKDAVQKIYSESYP
ncbi:hypothetical protein MIR68_010583 [Amoeboaphelidium protococcarum]|nr:hypothetical protein MIR68_010583 [Amoeboaphelidium protococcarum]